MSADTAAPIVRIEPTRGWRHLGLHEVWEYRELLYFLIWREIKGRYRQMALGPLWIIAAPILFAVIIARTLGRLAALGPEGLPYVLFIYSGQILWRVFSGAAANSSNSLVANMRLISKVYFPRLVVPIATTVTGLVDFAICFVILLGFMAFHGLTPAWAGLLAPVFVFLALAAALGLGLWLACLSVKFRDVAFGVNYLISLWFFASPVIYDAGRFDLSSRLGLLYRLNPMTVALDGFRWSLFGIGRAPDGVSLLSALLVALFLVSGAFVFRRTERTIVDVL